MAIAIKFPVPESRIYYGCKIDGIEGYKIYGGMRFLVIGSKKINNCNGSNHPYWKNINSGNSFTPEEEARLQRNEKGATPERAKKINFYFRGIWDEAAKNTGCGGTVNAGNYLGFPPMSYSEAARRAVTSSTGRTGPEFIADCQRKMTDCRKNNLGCKENGVNVQRSCKTKHAVGRAADIMNNASPPKSITDNYMFPDNLDRFTVSTCAYKLWDYYAQNAHRYFIANISNEWWHWQFFGTDKVGKDPIPPDVKTSEPPTDPNNVDTTGEASDNGTIEVTNTGGDVIGSSEEQPTEQEYEFVDPSEFEYSSLEAVEQSLPSYTLDRPQARLTGTKYLQDDLDLLVIDRFKNVVNTQSNSNDTKWESVKPVDEQPSAKQKQNELQNLQNRKIELEQEIEAKKTVIDKLSSILDKPSNTAGFTEEGLPESTINEIRKIKDTGIGVKELVENNISSGEDATVFMNKLTTEVDQKSVEVDNITSNLIPSAEKEYQLAVGELQGARDAVDGRISNLVSGVSGKIPSLPNSQIVDDTFKLFNEGDKALKEPIKIKLNKIPKISDLAVQLAGGLGLQSFLSSLSFAGLPGIEELDKIKSMADEAQSSLEGELNGLSGVLGDVGVSDALQSFQDLKNLKSQAESAISDAKGLYEQGEKLKKEAESKIQQAQTAFETAKSVATNLSNDIRSAGENLKNQGSALLEQAKNLPSTAAKELISQGNALISQGEQKINEAKATFDSTVNTARAEYSRLSSEANTLNNQYNEIQKNPKLQKAKDIQAKIETVQSEVDKISNSVSSEIVGKLEKAADYKNSVDTLKVKAAITQKNILSNVKSSGNEIDVKKHFAKDFKPFSEWVLDSTNTVPPDSEQPSFVIHRGPGGKVNEPDFTRLKDGTYKNYGISRFPTKYKSFCNFGNAGNYVIDNNKLFSGYTDKIMSPLDIAILLNAGNIGMFNNTIPYGFGEGSELAAPITFQKTQSGRNAGALFSKGGVGLGKNSNWAYFPEWAGLYVNFLLDKNGIYQSDLDFMDFTYIRRIESQYLNGNGVRLKNTEPITAIPKNYPGAIICYYNKASRKGNIELLLRVTLGGFLTLAGNTKIDGASKVGSTHGFKFYSSLKEFSPNDDIMVIQRGKKMGWTTNNRLDGRIKRTEIIDEYMKSIENKNSEKNTKLLVGGYSLLRDHLSDIIYSRNEVKNNVLSDNNRPISTDTSFQLHNEFNSYISGSRPLALDYNITVVNKEDLDPDGH